MQIPLKGRQVRLLDVMQFPVSILSGWLVSFYDTNLNFSHAGFVLHPVLLTGRVIAAVSGRLHQPMMRLAGLEPDASQGAEQPTGTSRA
jgi:hypothetical protein